MNNPTTTRRTNRYKQEEETEYLRRRPEEAEGQVTAGGMGRLLAWGLWPLGFGALYRRAAASGYGPLVTRSATWAYALAQRALGRLRAQRRQRVHRRPFFPPNF